jgi:dTDP-glucose pyrophosphorylase
VAALTFVVLAAGLGTRFGGVKPLAPVGPNGEAPIDLAVRDATDAGFDRVVVVTRPDLERPIRDRTRATVVVQAQPTGTAPAVVAARDAIDGAFAVGNGDDVYGAEAYRLLADHLRDDTSHHALVAYRLGRTLVGDRPVNRARLNFVGNRLLGVTERPVEPGRVDTEELVSMNLWGFRPSVWRWLDQPTTETGERLLPAVVDEMIAGGERVTVLPTDARCLSLTHPDDLALVQAALR